MKMRMQGKKLANTAGFFICCQPLRKAIIAACPLLGRILYTLTD